MTYQLSLPVPVKRRVGRPSLSQEEKDFRATLTPKERTARTNQATRERRAEKARQKDAQIAAAMAAGSSNGKRRAGSPASASPAPKRRRAERVEGSAAPEALYQLPPAASEASLVQSKALLSRAGTRDVIYVDADEGEDQKPEEEEADQEGDEEEPEEEEADQEGDEDPVDEEQEGDEEDLNGDELGDEDAESETEDDRHGGTDNETEHRPVIPHARWNSPFWVEYRKYDRSKLEALLKEPVKPHVENLWAVVVAILDLEPSLTREALLKEYEAKLDATFGVDDGFELEEFSEDDTNTFSTKWPDMELFPSEDYSD